MQIDLLLLERVGVSSFNAVSHQGRWRVILKSNEPDALRTGAGCWSKHMSVVARGVWA